MSKMRCWVLLIKILPILLSFQQLPVGGDFNVQGQLDVHQLLVLAHLAGHILLGSLEGSLQVPDTESGILHSQLTTLLCLGNLAFQVSTLVKKMEDGFIFDIVN